MTWRERWNHLLIALGAREDRMPEKVRQLCLSLDYQRQTIGILQSRIDGQHATIRMWKDRVFELETSAPNEGRANMIQIVQHNDAVGRLTVTMRTPSGQIEERTFDASNPVEIPAGWRVVQIGAISQNIPFENPSSMGTLLANALRRFNDNVLRNPTFRGIVRDEGMHPDGKEGGTSTLLLELGAYKYDIVISERKGEVPIGAISDPKIEDPRAN